MSSREGQGKYLRRNHPLYSRWKNMRNRCNNPNSQDYKNYGGRGISICDEWDDFWVFVDDMYESYSDGLTLERTDVNLGYCPDNCIWIANEEQANNKTNTHYIELDGIRMNIMQWSKYANVDRSNIYRRMSKGGLSTRQIIYGVNS